jgi:hypothetical protein
MRTLACHCSDNFSNPTTATDEKASLQQQLFPSIYFTLTDLHIPARYSHHKKELKCSIMSLGEKETFSYLCFAGTLTSTP